MGGSYCFTCSQKVEGCFCECQKRYLKCFLLAAVLGLISSFLINTDFSLIGNILVSIAAFFLLCGFCLCYARSSGNITKETPDGIEVEYTEGS